MRIFQNSRSPMARGNVCDGQVVMTVVIPPIEFDDFFKSEIRNKIEHMMRHNDSGCASRCAASMTNDRAQ